MIRKQYTAHHKFILCKRHEEKYVQVHYHGVTMVWFLSFRYHSILWLFVLPSTYKTFIEHFFTLCILVLLSVLAFDCISLLVCVNFNQQDSFDIVPAASHLQKRISNVTLFTPGYIMHSNLEINYVLYVNFAHLAAKKCISKITDCAFSLLHLLFCESFCTKSGVACLIIPL